VATPAAPDAPLNPPLAMSVGLLRALSDAGMFIALDNGYFQEQGLNVDVITFGLPPDIMPAVMTGQIQAAGLSHTPGMFNALSREVNMRIVADKGQVSRGHGWAALGVRKDLTDEIKDFKDLKGRKIAMGQQGSVIYFQLVRGLELGGLTVDDVDMVDLAFPDMLPALGSHAVDVATMLEPFIALGVAQDVITRWKGMEEFAPFDAQNGMLVYSEKFAREQPEAAKRFMVAYLRGVRAYLDAFERGIDRDAVIAILARNTPVKDQGLYLKMAPVGFDPNGRVNLQALEADQEMSIRLGLNRERVDLSKVVDNQYVDYAAARLGPRN
jgi:ABC-type nitrate/sulfonate/bicarbonate transport system substrate-binding protein